MTVNTIKSSIGYGSNPKGRPANDSYKTPDSAVEKLLEVEKFENFIWEPACGEGAISKVLLKHGYEVFSSDLYDCGYGVPYFDFLAHNYTIQPIKAVITNPPFNQAQEFIEHGLEVTKPQDGKLVLLLRLSFLEGQKRKALFENSPLKSVYVFSKRLTFHRPGDEGKDYSGMLAYAWFVFDWTHVGPPTLGWI